VSLMYYHDEVKSMYPVYVWPIYYLMKLIFNPDPILSSSFDRNRQNNQFNLPLLTRQQRSGPERTGPGFDRLDRGRGWREVEVLREHEVLPQWGWATASSGSTWKRSWWRQSQFMLKTNVLQNLFFKICTLIKISVAKWLETWSISGNG
jgi:hypothetical protein